jgi:hypothetical protein
MKTVVQLFCVGVLGLCSYSCKEKIIEPPVILDTVSCDSIPAGVSGTNLRMVWIDPNPAGDDNFSEKITLMNFSKSNERINTAGYYVENSLSRRFDLPGRWIEPCGLSEFVIDEVEMLENDGDTLHLYAVAGDKKIQTFIYSKTTEGVRLRVR